MLFHLTGQIIFYRILTVDSRVSNILKPYLQNIGNWTFLPVFTFLPFFPCFPSFICFSCFLENLLINWIWCFVVVCCFVKGIPSDEIIALWFSRFDFCLLLFHKKSIKDGGNAKRKKKTHEKLTKKETKMAKKKGGKSPRLLLKLYLFCCFLNVILCQLRNILACI